MTSVPKPSTRHVAPGGTTAVADVREVLDTGFVVGDPLLFERRESLPLLLREHAGELLMDEVGEWSVVRAREVLANLGLEHSPRGERSREAWHEHLGEIEL